jgi:hypothetical protein
VPLVYAADVKHDGEFVKKRGDKFTGKDAKDLFDLDGDETSLVDDGILCMDAELGEDRDPMSTSYYELQAEMARKYEEVGVNPESSDAGSVAKEPLKARGVQGKKDE